MIAALTSREEDRFLSGIKHSLHAHIDIFLSFVKHTIIILTQLT